MGGAVSAGRDNDELIDNLKGGKYIRTARVERVFRTLDRADYMLPHSRDSAYKDLAWKDGPLHLSAPCIYSEVMEGLELREGLSFLNIGSGTGYLSTMVGLILGSAGINHGIEIHPVVIEYANRHQQEFLMESNSVDEFDFCEPKFFLGNGLCLAPLQTQYDRVYCGAGCPEEYANYFKQLIKVGGILVMPLLDSLLQVRRTSQADWVTRSLLSVSFAELRVPHKEDTDELVKLEELSPPSLQVLARARVRSAMRRAVLSAHPHLAEPPLRREPLLPSGPRRICIPIEDDSDIENLNALHDLDPASGGTEMNALLSLVLTMGQNRVAGSLLYDQPSSSSTSSSDSASLFSSGESDAEQDDAAPTPAPAPPRDPPAVHAAAHGSQTPAALGEQARVHNVHTDNHNPWLDSGGKSTGTCADNEIDDGKAQTQTQEAQPEAQAAGSLSEGASAKATDDGLENSEMDCEDAYRATNSKRVRFANVDKTEKLRRQKLDSGIGDEDSAETSSSLDQSGSRSDESERASLRSDGSDVAVEPDVQRRKATRLRASRGGRAVKRSRRSFRARSSDTSTEEGESEPALGRAWAWHNKTKKRASAAGEERRRADLTALMQAAANALPLPPPLRLYVNLGRAPPFTNH